MPFTLFTIIQADDDALSPAADYLEHLFYTSHPRHSELMARNSERRLQQTQQEEQPSLRQQQTIDTTTPTSPPIDSANIEHSHDLPSPGGKTASATEQQQQNTATLRDTISINTREARPLSWSAPSPPLRFPAAGQHSRRAPQSVRTQVPSRSLTTSPVPSTQNNVTSTPPVHSRARSQPPATTSFPHHHHHHQRLSPRTRSPLRSVDESAPISLDSGFEIIAEDSELDLSQHHGLSERPLLPSQVYAKSTRTITPRRQRPASPLHGSGSSGMPLLSSASSPALSSMRYNEGFPSLHHFGSTSSFSSVTSTPSSMRSRSPSISSLDTIEDAPDLESKAIEGEKASMADKFESKLGGHDSARPRTASLETPKPISVGFGFGRANQRKRWSVCGGERRADLDLETIWED